MLLFTVCPAAAEAPGTCCGTEFSCGKFRRFIGLGEGNISFAEACSVMSERQEGARSHDQGFNAFARCGNHFNNAQFCNSDSDLHGGLEIDLIIWGAPAPLLFRQAFFISAYSGLVLLDSDHFLRRKLAELLYPSYLLIQFV